LSVNVTTTFLPPLEEYLSFLKKAWGKGWITNNGELVQELESKIKDFLYLDYFLFCSNGTIVIQLALKALGITKEVITTPFSYVATTNALLWEGCKPVFVDVREDSLCIDETKIEAAITKETEAILATHVYGLPCNVHEIEKLANKYNLKVIYDAAHAFGCVYQGKSLLSYGDISTCSFHATKLFHTVEGGGIVVNKKKLYDQIYLLRSFGHIGDDYFCEGINAKNSEFHAAMGLANLPYLKKIIEDRKQISLTYDSILPDFLRKPYSSLQSFEYNFSYYPVIFENENQLLVAKQKLASFGINTRRYFYPSLNLLPQVSEPKISCKISEDISKRVLSLPLFPGFNHMEEVIKIIKDSV
jgi:dTDP-4-amino-4,6-dideoxygalactose transaminase